MKFARPILIGTLALAFIFLSLIFADLILKSPSTPARVSFTPTPEITLTPTLTATPTEIANLPPPTPPSVSSEAYRQGMTLRTQGDYAHAAETFRAALAEKPDETLAREIQFRLGECLWLAGDYPNAIKELDALLTADDNWTARAHYFLADIYTQQHVYAKAVDHLRAYRAQTRALAGELDAEIGDVLLASGDRAGAIKQYELALQDETLSAAQRIAFLKKMADVQLQNNAPGLAAARLAQAFDLAPDSATSADVEYRWGLALDAAQQHALAVTHWRHAVATYPAEAGAYQSLVQLVNAKETVDDYQRGLVDYFAKAYTAATQAFARYAQAHPKQNSAALYYAGRAYQDNGQTTLAIKQFDALLKNYPQDAHAADAWYYKVRAQSASDLSGAGITAGQFVTRFPNDARADDALWQVARALDSAGNDAAARTQYEKLVSQYPASSFAPTALFNLGLNYYLKSDLTHAEAQWKIIAQKYPQDAEAAHAQLWLGKLAQARGDTTSAQQYWQQAAQPPRAYYGWRAADLLQPVMATPSYQVTDYAMHAQPNAIADFEKWLASWTGGQPVSAQLDATVLNNSQFRRGAELAQLDRAGEARLAFGQVNKQFAKDARALYALARFYQDNNYFDLALQAARQIQTLSGATDAQAPRYLRELIYPTYFAELIVPYAERNNLDPALFFALVRQESIFNPLAQSWVGAAGLAQVMPQTGAGIARELGMRDFKTSELTKPYLSIRFGTFYLGQQLKSFDGNPFYALAAYNGGPGNAKKWQRPDVDLALEAIHLSESYTYVRTVYAQYNQYRQLYTTAP